MEGEDEEVSKSGTDESIDVWRELKRGISVADEEEEEKRRKSERVFR